MNPHHFTAWTVKLLKRILLFFSLFPLFYWQLWPHHSEFFWPRETERSYFASDERRSILHSIFWLKKSKSLQLQSLKIQVVSAFKSLQIWAFFLKKEIIKSSSKNIQNPKKNPLSNQKWNKTLLQNNKSWKVGVSSLNNFFRYCSTTTTIYYSTKTKHEKKNSTTFYLYCSILFLIYLTPRWHCQKNRLFMSNVTARALPSLKKVLL